MKILFIDSDVLLDVILNRAPHYSSSTKILALADRPDFLCGTTVHALLNVHYVTKKHIGLESANQAIKLLFKKLDIITENKAIVGQAISSEFLDFEDAVQHFAAVNAKADAIITRNIKDYKHAIIPVLTPEQFLRTIL